MGAIVHESLLRFQPRTSLGVDGFCSQCGGQRKLPAVSGWPESKVPLSDQRASVKNALCFQTPLLLAEQGESLIHASASPGHQAAFAVGQVWSPPALCMFPCAFAR